jgi:predicted TIM-barrel fold metal-dependent hydrolase
VSVRGQAGSGIVPGAWTGVLLALAGGACGHGGGGVPPHSDPFPLPIPKIDVHTHLDPRAIGVALAIFDEHGIGTAINASGGMPGEGLEAVVAAARSTNGRIHVLCNLDWSRAEEAGFGEWAAGVLERAKAAGAIGLKVPKALGLGYRLSDGTPLGVHDPRLDPVFEKAGALGMPVLIHTGDPRAFFEPATRDNERYEELSVHPDWSFADRTLFPSFAELLASFERRVARHPRTTFVGAHFGNAAEDPDFVGRMLERHANYFVDTAARVPEIGRHDPARIRRFFERWQDRILFGTDLGVGRRGLMLGSPGASPPTQGDVRRFFDAHWRYFETAERRFAHPTPIQGRWTIDGIDLPRSVLEKVYRGNAARVFGIPAPTSLAPH